MSYEQRLELTEPSAWSPLGALAAAAAERAAEAGAAARAVRRGRVDGGAARRTTAVNAADVDDDRADEDLERDGGHQQTEDQRVEPVGRGADVEQQLELGDLCEREDRDQRLSVSVCLSASISQELQSNEGEDRDECRLGAHLALLQLRTPRQHLHVPHRQRHSIAKSSTSFAGVKAGINGVVKLE